MSGFPGGADDTGTSRTWAVRAYRVVYGRLYPAVGAAAAGLAHAAVAAALRRRIGSYPEFARWAVGEARRLAGIQR